MHGLFFLTTRKSGHRKPMERRTHSRVTVLVVSMLLFKCLYGSPESYYLIKKNIHSHINLNRCLIPSFELFWLTAMMAFRMALFRLFVFLHGVFSSFPPRKDEIAHSSHHIPRLPLLHDILKCLWTVHVAFPCYLPRISDSFSNKVHRFRCGSIC